MPTSLLHMEPWESVLECKFPVYINIISALLKLMHTFIYLFSVYLK